MKIETHVADRKTLVNQIAQAIGEEAKYLGAPGFAYQVGPYTINKQAEIEGDDTEADMDPLRELVLGGVLDDAEDEEIAALEISVPIEEHEFLISSHHPLRETSIKQTGATEAERRSFLASIDQRAIDALIHRWETPEVAPATF